MSLASHHFQLRLAIQISELEYYCDHTNGLFTYMDLFRVGCRFYGNGFVYLRLFYLELRICRVLLLLIFDLYSANMYVNKMLTHICVKLGLIVTVSMTK